MAFKGNVMSGLLCWSLKLHWVSCSPGCWRLVQGLQQKTDSRHGSTVERGAFLDGGFPGAWAELKDNASLSIRKNTLRTFITFLPGLHVSSVRIHCQNETLKGEQTRIPMSHVSATESSLYLGYFLQTSLIIIKETSVTFLKGYERITLNQSPAIQKSPPSSPIFVKGCKYLPHFHFINHPVASHS